MNVLEEAQKIVDGPRAQEYGSVRSSFIRIATLWSAIIGVEVTPSMVGLCMIASKLSRERNLKKRDNLVDIAGYARCLEMLDE